MTFTDVSSFGPLMCNNVFFVGLCTVQCIAYFDNSINSFIAAQAVSGLMSLKAH